MILCGQVPAVKRSLERFVYEVKGLFAKTQYKDNFWMGRLNLPFATESSSYSCSKTSFYTSFTKMKSGGAAVMVLEGIQSCLLLINLSRR